MAVGAKGRLPFSRGLHYSVVPTVKSRLLVAAHCDGPGVSICVGRVIHSAQTTLQEANWDLAAWIGKWQGKYPKLVDRVENNTGETLSFHRVPRAHHKHLKSTNKLERLNDEIKRRTRVVRIFPNETWLEDSRYLNMTFLAEQKKEQLRRAV